MVGAEKEILQETAGRLLEAMQEVVSQSFRPRMITDGHTKLPLYPSTKGLVDMAQLLTEVCDSAQRAGVPEW